MAQYDTLVMCLRKLEIKVLRTETTEAALDLRRMIVEPVMVGTITPKINGMNSTETSKLQSQEKLSAGEVIEKHCD
jgi:hypothetical protein